MVNRKSSSAKPGNKNDIGKYSKHTTVRLSEILKSNIRIDASSYGIESRKAVDALKTSALPLKQLYGDKGLCHEAHNAFRFARIYVDGKYGVPFLSSSDIIVIRPESNHFLSKKQTRNLDRLLIHKWDVMISCSGTIGNVALAGSRLSGSALSQHVIRLRSKNPQTAGYVTAFLRSKYGRPQLTGSAYGSVVTHIEPEHLSHVIIPDIHPIKISEIGNGMVRAVELRDEANRLLDEADILLHLHLNLPPLSSLAAGEGKTNSLRLKAHKLSDRFEASFYSPMVQLAEKQLESIDTDITKLNDPAVTQKILAVTKFRKRTYVVFGGIPMLTSKQLSQVDPVDIKRLAKGAHIKDLPEIQLHTDMITITRSGTIGKIFIVPDYMDKWTSSEDTIRVVSSEKMNPGYLYAWLASDYAHTFIKRHSYGSVIVHIDKNMLGSIPIPLPDKVKRDEIGGLVLKANKLRGEAWNLEGMAISQLVNIIERINTI